VIFILANSIPINVYIIISNLFAHVTVYIVDLFDLVHFVP